jgi:hypothetical protein
MATVRSDELERVAAWLVDSVVHEGRGDRHDQLEVKPAEKFWLGRLAPELGMNAALGDRGERMEPCAIGIRLRPSGQPPWSFRVDVGLCAWHKDKAARLWRKTCRVSQQLPCTVTRGQANQEHRLRELESALEQQLNVDHLGARLEVEWSRRPDGSDEIVVSCVNASLAESKDLGDTGLYEVQMGVKGLGTAPYVLESLPDSFRYDRRVPAFGINCGVEAGEDGGLRSTDVIVADRNRPVFWNSDGTPPDFRFVNLAEDPLPSLRSLVEAHREWGRQNWADGPLQARTASEHWTEGMLAEARQAADEVRQEYRRLAQGVSRLESRPDLLLAFRLMNEAMALSARGKYDSWRPFQIGFILANIESLSADRADRGIVDILWFPTGGGKTETYLGLLLMAAFLDRLTGKHAGLTAWTRFPLRLLSLQQTQRFANALGGAEQVRRRAGLGGEPFSLGFFVGESSTPNRIKLNPEAGEPNPNDDQMPDRYRILTRCPFCDGDIQMAFDRRSWRLAHRCPNEGCPWPEDNLPVYVVDEEIYRFLPTVVVGTLDKVASIALQGSMRGLFGSPWGRCSAGGHGFTYGPRSERPNGCLVPQCRGTAQPLPMDAARFQPTFRLQDELHLLRDSLGAIDAHYERLLDRLLGENECPPKIVGSSATLSGFQHQCNVLYDRRARVFPVPGPSPGHSFWSRDDDSLLRRYVAVAPRGATLEFATDRIITELQRAVRRLLQDPALVCREMGLREECVGEVVSLYGTNVIYGNTIRDVDASLRSMETQIPVSGPLFTARLTGDTPFERVRETLDRLQQPEASFDERVHVIGASSMMSHGVDIDRLNSMVMLGMPLTAAEFIQATARIGRTYPGVVFVIHKMALERDASVFRSFGVYVRQGDRFVEPIPITSRSRRVLERTLPGLKEAVRTHVHERAANKALTTIKSLREYAQGGGMTVPGEVETLLHILGLDPAVDGRLCECVREWVTEYHRTLMNPTGSIKWPSDCSPSNKPMMSLRDVEEQAPIFD